MATTDARQLILRPPVVAMEWYRGSTLPFTVTGTDTAGDPIDLTGATVKMEVKDAAGDVVLTLQTGGTGIVLTDAANGQMTISPEVVGTSSMALFVVYNYDLKVTLADTTVTPWIRGTITLVEKITS